MGLDMYLTGEKFFTCFGEEKRKIEDGYEVKEHHLDLGYWRKHPDLHGYIIDNFNKGVDDCRPINLTPDDIVRIIEAIQEDRLPKTSGFFFGESSNNKEEKEEALEILQMAFDWITKDQEGCWKYIRYQASW